jgi:ferritin-like metal-binding protein YciE
MAKVSTMDELFIDELRDLYDAEKQLTKALPKMAKAASSEELREAFTSHLEETEGQVQRLEEAFESLGEKAGGKKCAAMAGLVKEGDELAKEIEQGPVRDAGLIAAAQKVEHYEISGYGSARTHAQMLGHEDVASLLQETEDEEKEADRKLNELAQSEVNEDAAGTPSGSAGSMSASGKARAAGSKKTAQPKTRTAGGGGSSSR